jgi:acyl carrier protein
MSVRPTIIATFQEVASSQGVDLAPLSDSLELLESGLDSLCFAIIVASLEDVLGVDPFSEDEEFSFPVTFGDFVESYENAAASR